MSTLFTNAPIQNRDFNPDISSGSVLPIVVAEYQSAETPRVDLWNNVLAVEQRGHDAFSFRAAAGERLDAKYYSNLLCQLSVPADVITDDSASFREWGAEVTRQGLDSGVLSVEKREVHACDQCDGTIAHAEVPITNGCVSCDSPSTHVAEKSVLVAKLGPAAWEAAAIITADPSLMTGHSGEMEVIVNKKRLAGIPLDEFGFTGDVVDPKVGIGLLAIFAARQYDRPDVSIVAGRSSSNKNVPQLAAFLGGNRSKYPQLRISQISRAPLKYLGYLRDEEIISADRYRDIICNVLPPLLLSMKHDMTPRTLDRVIFSKRTSKGIAK